jgi:hypothetical protein
MQAQSWTDILKLLSMMIISNKPDNRNESKVFKEAALSLRDAVYPELNLTSEMAGDWLELHREEISRSMSSIHFDETLAGILKNLRILPNKKPIILTMIKMTLTEGEPSKNQDRVLSEMNTVWGNPKAESRVA